jgi:hypothetical protein
VAVPLHLPLPLPAPLPLPLPAPLPLPPSSLLIYLLTNPSRFFLILCPIPKLVSI